MSSSQTTEDETASKQAEILAHEPQNLFLLAMHHVCLRVGWIFKTETVVMPAFLDVIHGAGWVRGCLPLLNHVGQSIVPMFFADRLRRSKRKKVALISMVLGMAIPFLLLSAIWGRVYSESPVWMPFCFLGCYWVFFGVSGLYQMSWGTVQGKLIRPHRRGRLMSISSIVGSVMSIAAAYMLLTRCLMLPDGGFSRMFLATGMGFFAAGLIALWLHEPEDSETRKPGHAFQGFVESWHYVKTHRDLRILVFVAMLFVTAQFAFPHYQSIGRKASGSDFKIMHWLIAQNAGAGLFGLIAGTIADRWGNRLALRILIFGASLTPIISLSLAVWFPQIGVPYWITFLILGTVPTTFKALNNYALEITDSSNHPRYLSTLRLAMMVPFFLSPLYGLLIDVAGFEPVFIATSIVILMGSLMTFRLSEPRFES